MRLEKTLTVGNTATGSQGRDFEDKEVDLEDTELHDSRVDGSRHFTLFPNHLPHPQEQPGLRRLPQLRPGFLKTGLN